MFKSETKVRVRYSETDMMGYVYYGNYATYFEVARVESIKSLGFSYRKMEDEGIALPVLDFSIKYYKPAFYDDELRIETIVTKIPGARIHFEYKTFNDKNELINQASTTLVFVSKKTMKPCSAPFNFVEQLKKYF